MYETTQLSNKLEMAITNAIETLKDGTHIFDDVSLDFKINTKNQIIISAVAMDGSALEPSLYADMFETFDIIDFTDRKPHLIKGDFIIRDRQGEPKDWQTPLLEGMSIVADIMWPQKANTFTLTCDTCKSNNCDIMINDNETYVDVTCFDCGIIHCRPITYQ